MRFLTVWGLLPLYCRAGLGGEVEEDAVDVLYLACDALGDVLQQLEGYVLHRSGHGVLGVDSADDDGVSEGALAVLDAYRLEVRHGGEVLPNLALETVLRELLAQDSVALADGFEPVAGDRAQAANAQAGAGERLTIDHAVRQTESLADYSDLVLEQQLDRLYQLELQILGQTADVVMSLYAVVRFEDVGIDGSLCEELDAVELSSLLLKHADELGADDLALFFGLGNACELVEEAIHGVDIDEVRVHLIAEHLDNLLGLALAEESVVHVYADELLTDRLDEQGGDNGAVYTAREREQNFFIADLSTKLLYLFINKGLR